MGGTSRRGAVLVAVFATLMIVVASWLSTAANPAIATSTCAEPGASWTTRIFAADNAWRSVTWGGPAGQELFVAVATSGAGNRVMTSPDGITWTARTSAADTTWNSVTWGGPTGQEQFVAVATFGAGNRVMTSSCPSAPIPITPAPAPAPAPAPIVSLHHASLDPNGGSCLINGTATTTSTRTPFLGYTYIPGAEECSRPGFTFQGWAARTKPEAVYALPLLRGWDDGVWRYFIADTYDLIAVWKTTG